MRVVNAMSFCSPHLKADVRRLHSLLAARGLLIEATWLASVENTWAGNLSRERDSSDWRLARSVFSALERAWGPMTVDRFATPLNTLLPRFNSRTLTLCPGTEAVDAHAQPWAGEHNFRNPPLALVAPTLRKIRDERASAVVIVPVWPVQDWWRSAVTDADAAVLLPPSAIVRSRTGAASTTLPSWRPSALPAQERPRPGVF